MEFQTARNKETLYWAVLILYLVVIMVVLVTFANVVTNQIHHIQLTSFSSVGSGVVQQ